MAATFKNFLTDEDKEKFIDALSENLPALRAKVGVSQGDLAQLIGVSRQTYCAVESGLRRMSWNTYLSLILFFDYNQSTHQMLRSISAFPEGFVDGMNKGKKALAFDPAMLLGDEFSDIVGCLDEQALHSIRTVLMVEYARCAKLPGDAVIKSFNGVNFDIRTSSNDRKAARSLKKNKREAQ